jgi:hypothetical protein
MDHELVSLETALRPGNRAARLKFPPEKAERAGFLAA